MKVIAKQPLLGFLAQPLRARCRRGDKLILERVHSRRKNGAH